MPSSSDVPSSRPRPAVGKRLSDFTLLLGRPLEVGCELWVALHFLAPALHPARGLEPGDRRDELRAREVVRGRKRVAGVVVRRLLGHRGRPERAAGDYAEERAGPSAKLSLDERAVIHPARS